MFSFVFGDLRPGACLNFVELCRALLGFAFFGGPSWLYWVCWIRIVRALLGFLGFCKALLGFAGLCWALLGFAGLC